MRKIFILIIIPLICSSQNEQIQAIGSLATYVMTCPCKLFKYYENGEMFYFCEDKTSSVKYMIKEFKHKDGIDVMFNMINKNITKKATYPFDKIVDIAKNETLDIYLNNNPIGIKIDFMGKKAILVDGVNEKKIFFSDDELIASYEIIVSGSDSTEVNKWFNKSVASLMLKRKNLKKIFGF